MTLRKCFLLFCFATGLAGAAYLAREAEDPGSRMVTAAEKFTGSLTKDQAKKANFEFDDKERLRWYFTPQQVKRKHTRKGLPFSELSDKQKTLALAMLRTGTSADGYTMATTIMSLEAILADLEKSGPILRDPDMYFVTFFGSPSKTGKWGWRVEGHHLSLNFTLDGSKVVATTPFFLGANPAEVKAGKQKGTTALAPSADRFRDLLKLLDADQKKTAFVKGLFKDVDEGNQRPKLGKPVGIAGDKLNDKQKAALTKLIEAYLDRMPPEVAAAEAAEIKKAGFDVIHFAYGLGDGTPGKPYQYRVHGQNFLIEFINEQADSAKNPANHIHSVWRKIEGDFGLSAK